MEEREVLTLSLKNKREWAIICINVAMIIYIFRDIKTKQRGFKIKIQEERNALYVEMNQRNTKIIFKNLLELIENKGDSSEFTLSTSMKKLNWLANRKMSSQDNSELIRSANYCTLSEKIHFHVRSATKNNQ